MLTHRVSFFDPDQPREALFETPGERDELLEKLKQIPFKSPSVEQVAPTISREDMAGTSTRDRPARRNLPIIPSAEKCFTTACFTALFVFSVTQRTLPYDIHGETPRLVSGSSPTAAPKH